MTGRRGVAARARGLPREAEELLADDAFNRALADVAREQGTGTDAVRAEATSYLREMAASHSEWLTGQWVRLGDWFLRAYESWSTRTQMQRLRQLDR